MNFDLSMALLKPRVWAPLFCVSVCLLGANVGLFGDNVSEDAETGVAMAREKAMVPEGSLRLNALQDDEGVKQEKEAAGDKENPLQHFTKRVLIRGGKELKFQMMEPAAWQESDKKFPLVIFLHGAGERGDDNEAQLVHGMKDFASDANREKYPCFVVAPQCPKNESWASIDRTQEKAALADQPSKALALVMELIQQTETEYPIDSERIYITGLSMGGYGTWDAIERYPDRFAAALPICGGGDSSQEQVSKIVKLPIWVFHGGDDTVVPAARSIEMVEAIKQAGGEPKYTQYEGVGHDSWTETYKNPEVLKWLFSQKRTAPGKALDDAPANEDDQ